MLLVVAERIACVLDNDVILVVFRDGQLLGDRVEHKADLDRVLNRCDDEDRDDNGKDYQDPYYGVLLG